MPDIAPTALPMQEALEYWKSKVPMSAREFYGLAEAARGNAFTVSGVASMDAIVKIQESLGKALSEGLSFEQWKKEIPGIILKQGWTGKGARRLETIFRTNIQTAYHVGRWKQMQAVKALRPYWQYDAVNDSRTRPAHRALDGKVFPADHPFWDTWYPPNGHRCRCGVKSLSDRQVKALGLTVETEDPTGRLFEPVDEKGNRLLARPLMPDRGFNANAAREHYEPDLSLYPQRLRDIFLKKRGELFASAGAVPEIETYPEAGAFIKERLAPLAGPSGIESVYFTRRGDFMMATNGAGDFYVTDRAFPESGGFNPAKDLLGALRAIREGAPLSFNREYAVETLQHELLHSRQTPGEALDSLDPRDILQETLTQHLSRRTYQRILSLLGAGASNQEAIKAAGYAYGRYVKNFGLLLERLGLGDELLSEIEELYLTAKRDSYAEPLARLLARRAARPEDRPRIMSVLMRLNETSEDFGRLLGDL